MKELCPKTELSTLIYRINYSMKSLEFNPACKVLCTVHIGVPINQQLHHFYHGAKVLLAERAHAPAKDGLHYL